MTKDEAIKVLKMVEAHGLAAVAKVIAIEALETEAIPVEWIKKRMLNVEDTMLGVAYSVLISEWEDEQAERKEDIRICGICKHFLGGGDFGTCCDQTYDLKYTDSKVCEKYSERRTE